MLCSRRRRARPPGAPEARQRVAHSETVGLHAPTNPAPAGAKESSVCAFLPPLPGLEIALLDSPTVAPWAIALRHSVAEIAGSV